MGHALLTNWKRLSLPLAAATLFSVLLCGSLSPASAAPVLKSTIPTVNIQNPVQIPVDEHPDGLVIDQLHKIAYVVSDGEYEQPATLDSILGNPTLTVIDLKLNAVIATLCLEPLGFESDNAEHLAVNPNTQKLYIADECGGQILVIDVSDPDDPELDDTTPNPFPILQAPCAAMESSLSPFEPEGIAVDPVTNLVYVTVKPSVLLNGAAQVGGIDYRGFLLAFDPAENYELVAYTQVGLCPEDVVLNPKNNDLYVANEGDGTIFVVTKLVRKGDCFIGFKFVKSLAPFAVKGCCWLSTVGDLAVDTCTGTVYATDDIYRVAGIDTKFCVAVVALGPKPKTPYDYADGRALADEITVDSTRHLVYVSSNNQLITVINGTNLCIVEKIKINLACGLDAIGVLSSLNKVVVNDFLGGITYIIKGN